MKPVSTLEQRDLCLGGAYQTCPRLREAPGGDLEGIVADEREQASTIRPLSRGQGRSVAAPLANARTTVPAAVELSAAVSYVDSVGHKLRTVASRNHLVLTVFAISLLVAAVLAWSFLQFVP